MNNERDGAGVKTHRDEASEGDTTSDSRVTNLLHDAGLALGKCDVATRLVCDELDLDFAALAATGLIIIIAIISSRLALSFGATDVSKASTISNAIVMDRRKLGVNVGDVGGHGDDVLSCWTD